jgi:hypothetical protein
MGGLRVFYICFLMAIVGDKGGSVQIDGIS